MTVRGKHKMEKGFNYSFMGAPLGEVLIASTEKGICALEFIETHRENSIDSVKQRLNTPLSFYRKDPFLELTEEYLNRYFNSPGSINNIKIPLDFHGTPFQKLIWNELLNIPLGTTVSYSGIAANAGCPHAARAVGNAVGANPISIIVPCHRVIRTDGSLGGYRWGRMRKEKLLELERQNNLN